MSIVPWKKYIVDIVPYLDRRLLKIRPDYPGQFKIVMQYLLANEFIGKFPYYSFSREKFVFTDDMKKEAEEIINCWGIEIN